MVDNSNLNIDQLTEKVNAISEEISLLTKQSMAIVKQINSELDKRKSENPKDIVNYCRTCNEVHFGWTCWGCYESACYDD